MSNFNETPRSNRVHIGIYGKTNSGKSSFINAFTKQEVSIVSHTKGTTTDPVYKAMEIQPLGPCVFIDTAGFDDQSELGVRRVLKTEETLEKVDIAVIILDACSTFNESCDEYKWYLKLKDKKVPTLFIVNKIDLCQSYEALALQIETITKQVPVCISTTNLVGLEKVKDVLVSLLPEEEVGNDITGSLVKKGDIVVLVMPQDKQAPKGRLILPQVQVIRELLDKGCVVVSVTTDEFTSALEKLKDVPNVIITDSQVFDYVYAHKPEHSKLTSFSVLLAGYKGDISYYVEGVKAIDTLTENSKVLIAECCTHAPLEEDIGRVKIPNMLKKRVGKNLQIDVVAGVNYPSDLSQYDLIIQCGACMFNKKYVLSRIDRAKSQNIPMTNYGITIAYIKGILDRIEL